MQCGVILLFLGRLFNKSHSGDVVASLIPYFIKQGPPVTVSRDDRLLEGSAHSEQVYHPEQEKSGTSL
jgi:hypothetical protein